MAETTKGPDATKEHRPQFTTLSGQALNRVYSGDDLRGWNPEESLGYPGEFPYTRGIYPSMYRSRLWTMRQYAGFGSAAESNQRYRYLLRQGQSGLSVAFDLPTQMGMDSDHPLAQGEVGRVGVAIASLEDMETLFEAIPLENVSTSMTINSTAAILLCLYVAVAKKQGANLRKLSGTVQNDILKEYISRGTYIYPVRPAMRIVTDIFAWCRAALPKWNTISISGYHIREAGSTVVQEVAFTLADGVAYIEAALAAGLAVDEFAPQLSFFFNAHNDLLEEIAKYRAARRIWHKAVTERYGSKNPRTWALRFHSQTAGCSLTAQQPFNNVVRTALQALAAVLGGTQSLHTNSLDEAWALPTEFAATIALRTQQIIAHETGVTNTVDPFGGSYFVEALTNEVEAGAWDYIRKIDSMGGMVAAIERSYPQREIAEASYRYQMELDKKEKIMVGVNDFVSDEKPLQILQIDETVAHRQAARLKKLRADRSQAEVNRSLLALQRAAESGTLRPASGNSSSASPHAVHPQNLMPHIYSAVKAYATLGEICDAFRSAFGTYEEAAVT